jgi:hypothetical protein
MLQLSDDAGRVLAESASAPVGGRVPFAGLAAGQALRDPQTLTLPADLAPGIYDLALGRQRSDGTWLPIRRGAVALGRTYPLATIRVPGRPLNLTPPDVQYPVEARFGEAIRLLGYDTPAPSFHDQDPISSIELVLHWQAIAPTATPFKIFLHLVSEDGPAGIMSQADLYTLLPTSGWVPGEYLADGASLDVPLGLPPGDYVLLLGFYDEATGDRLPVRDATGQDLGDSLVLGTFRLGQ